MITGWKRSRTLEEIIRAWEANVSDERSEFREKATKPHRRINPCFMTGKGCVYTEQIDREFEHRREKQSFSGFMILPFRPNISVFYDLCLKRFVSSYGTADGPVSIIKADQVRKTGYVICEKICKKIQESDFVIADISMPNANVFYELGLAYGIGQKIVTIYHYKETFGVEISKYLSEAGCKSYAYEDLKPLMMEHFPISNYIWQRSASFAAETMPTTLLIDNLNFPGGSFNSLGEQHPQDDMVGDISLSFASNVAAAVGVAIDNISTEIKGGQLSIKIPDTYYPLISELRTAREVQKDANFNDILEKIEQSFCAIIRTGGKNCNPMMYFWLGYCHARGKNVIPITTIAREGEAIDDLAFDIRALWHMTFSLKDPSSLASEVEETLHQMILSDFTEWSRRRLWDEMLEKRGKVSIFTGALHNKDIGREMIGDWDLRAASELTSYFASHQYRATIESPIYQIEHVVGKKIVGRDVYIEKLEEMVSEKNCVIIASPDVNPLTELLLGKIYGVDKEDWFGADPEFDAANHAPNAVVAFKRKPVEEGATADNTRVNSTFYREYTDQGERDRGFLAPFVKNKKIAGSFVSQTATPEPFTVHAHLVVVPNPYCSKSETQKFIVILNGVSGPATFALTHVLTGGVSREFVSYGQNFDPNSESEKILKQILEEFNSSQREKHGYHCILEVKVGPLTEGTDVKSRGRGIFDWRHILEWKLIRGVVFELTT